MTVSKAKVCPHSSDNTETVERARKIQKKNLERLEREIFYLNRSSVRATWLHPKFYSQQEPQGFYLENTTLPVTTFTNSAQFSTAFPFIKFYCTDHST